MSIPRPDSTSPYPALGEGSDNELTGLIKRLIREVEVGASRLPQDSQIAPGLDSLGSNAPGLAGGFPSPANPHHPEVHPSNPSFTEAQPQPVRSSQSLQVPPTGGHEPGSSETYPFGEPRCNGSVFAPTTSRSASNPAKTSPEGHREVPHGSSGTAPRLHVDSVRSDFPALHQRIHGKPLIWLDNAATTHKPQAVIDATSRFYSRDNSNIHRAAHTLAVRSTDLFEEGREKVRQFLGASSVEEVVFVRGTTEAINLVAQSYGRQNVKAGDEIILTELEHHANIVPWQLLAEQVGAKIRVVPINDRGELEMDQYVRLLGPRTKFVSVAHVSNSLGTVNPVEEIIALAHTHGARVLVDGAQSTPHMPVDVRSIDADFYAFSGHKIFGPTGIGALYGKRELLETMPPWQGGGHMIRDVRFEKTEYQNAPEKFEAGTPDIAGVVGLAAAIGYLQRLGMPAIAAYEHALLEYAMDAISRVRGLRFIGTARTKASVLSFIIPGVANEKIARHLDREGIAVRAGHHCAQPAQRHFGLETTVRPSLAFYNTMQEVDALVSALHALPRS